MRAAGLQGLQLRRFVTTTVDSRLTVRCPPWSSWTLFDSFRLTFLSFSVRHPWALQARVLGRVDDPHATVAEVGGDGVRAEGGACGEGHTEAGLYARIPRWSASRRTCPQRAVAGRLRSTAQDRAQQVVADRRWTLACLCSRITSNHVHLGSTGLFAGYGFAAPFVGSRRLAAHHPSDAATIGLSCCWCT